MKKSILKYFKAFTLIGIMASFIAITSCGSDDGGDDPDPVEVTDSILDLINNTDGLDSLKKYLNRYPSLTAALDAEGSYTFFAPTNDAFIGLLQTPGFPSNIDLINPDIIEGVLAYHVVAGTKVSTSDFTTDNDLNTLYTDPLSDEVQIIEFNSDGTILTGSTTKNIEVVEGDIEATNGVMHTTASVLIPPSVGETLTPILGTIAGSVLLGADFSIIAEGILMADAGKDAAATISGALAALPNLTVFAPTNATFESLGITAGDLTAAEWDAYVRNHIVVGGETYGNTGVTTIATADLVTCAEFTTLGGGTLTIFNNTDLVPADNGIGVYIDSNGDVDCTLSDMGASLTNLDAEVALPNAVNISQGRIHVIAGILVPAE